MENTMEQKNDHLEDDREDFVISKKLRDLIDRVVIEEPEDA